jgi:hypothetical protein
MSETPPKQENLTDALHKLGENLIQTLQAAWDSPERKKITQEIEVGLTDISSTVKRETEHFSESPTGQQLKSDVDDLRERVRSGETEAQLRQELLKALDLVNSELEKAASRLRKVDTTESSPNESDQGEV